MTATLTAVKTPAKRTTKAARMANDADVVKAADTAAAPAVVEISRLETEIMDVPIIGTAPLITHRFSEKARRQMLDAMQGKKKVREAKDPQAEFESAFYRLHNGEFGFPSIAFKNATVSGARYYAGLTMTLLRQLIFINGVYGVDGLALVRIEGNPEIVMREDVVRVGQNGTDLRYRPQFTTWGTTLRVRYVKSQLSRQSVLSLIDAGGMGVGVGEWRPEKKGEMGTFAIDEDRQLVVITK